MERAQKIAYVRSNSNTLKGVKGSDEKIRLSVMDLIGDEEEDEEEVVEGVCGRGEGGRRRLRLRRRKGGEGDGVDM